MCNKQEIFQSNQNIYQIAPIEILSSPQSLGYVNARAFGVANPSKQISFASASPWLISPAKFFVQ